MRRALAAGLMVLVVATPVAAQDPTTVCTEVVVPEGLTNEPSLVQGRPVDGDCDMVVYLPFALVDALAYGQGIQTLDEHRRGAEESARLDAMTCDQLAEQRVKYLDLSFDLDRVILAWLDRCVPCEDIAELRAGGEGENVAVLASVTWTLKCEPRPSPAA